MSVTALLDRLDALEARLDAARRQSEAPGQLALNLLGGGAAPSGKKGPGGGEQCGGSWIDPNKDCHKGQGQAGPTEPPPMEARRSRPKERISFEQPIVGPTGAKLTGYTWQWTLEEVPDKEGELVEKRVSNWEESLPNVETGRNVVHQFEVQVGGEARVVSAESALKLLGFTDPDDKKRFGSLKSTARTVARLRMGLHQLDQVEKSWQADWAAVESSERPEISSGEWEQRDGYRVRTWRMGDAKVDQIHNSLGVWSEQEVVSNLVTEWKGQQMEQRGWDWTGRAERTMQSKLNRERDDLQKRLQRAEKKLQAAQGGASRSDSLSSRLDSFQARLDALKRRCSTGYGCGSACISVKKECRSSPAAATSRERLQRLEQLARGEIKPRGIGVPKAEEARAMASELQAQRQEQQAVIKAERKRRQAEAKASGRKPSVKVELQRAKPGGEFGPDGHWYPGGAWMSQGAYVGAKAEPIGEGQQGGRGEGEKSGPLEPRVVRPKRKPRRMRPLEPRGEGLPRPTGLKKIATQNDEEWFNDRGYITYPRPERSQYRGLGGTAFEAAVIQRLSSDELRWATSQILRIAKRSPGDHAEMLLRVKDIDRDIKRMGGLEAWAENERWTVRRELIGVDDERLRAGRIFLTLAPFLGSTSPAAARLREAFRNPSEEQMERFEWDRRAYEETLPEFPGEDGARVWALNNVFRAVARRRQAAAGSRRDALNAFQARLDAVQRKCKTGYGCGSTCISVKKECRSNPESSLSKERAERLSQLVTGEIKPRGIGVPKPDEASRRALEIRKFQRTGIKPDWYVGSKAAAVSENGPDPDELDVSSGEARLAFAKRLRGRGIARPGASFDANSLASATLKLCDMPGEAGRNARRMARFLNDSNVTIVVDAIRPDLRPNHRGAVGERHIAHLLTPDAIQKASINNPMVSRLAASIEYCEGQISQSRKNKKLIEEGMKEDKKNGWDTPDRVQDDKDRLLFHDKNIKHSKKMLQVNYSKLGALLMGVPAAAGLASRNGTLRLRDDPDSDRPWSPEGPDLEKMTARVQRQVETYGDVGATSTNTVGGGVGHTEYRLVTFIHEVGHMVQFASGDARNTIPKLSDELKAELKMMEPDAIGGGSLVGPNKHFVSDYSTTNGLELFAESFVAFVAAPEQLRRRSPAVYAWVDDTLRRATANPTLPPTPVT